MSLLIRQLTLAQPRFAARAATLNTCKASRAFISTRECRNEPAEQVRNNHQFPWLLSRDSPRIQEYPYVAADKSWFIIGWLPKSIQHMLSHWLGTRLLQLNTGLSYFPDEFLQGAQSACQPVLQLLSEHLSHPTEEARQKLETMVGSQLLDRYTEAASHYFDNEAMVSITMPQMHDARLGDIWVSLGNPQAFSGDKQYNVLEWMTFKLGVKKSLLEDSETSFAEYRTQVARTLMEGLLIRVDVEIDATLVYKVTRGDNMLVYDEGRRILSLRFETPHFKPADKIITDRDNDTGEPINDWTWRLVDIDHLLQKDQLDKNSNEEE